jgi:thiamine biosynthesis lipoprotein
MDPLTGEPAETNVLSATVVAPNTSLAEIGAKVALLLGSREGLAWLEARADLAGMVVLDNGEVLHTSRMSSYLWSSLE